MVKHTTNIRLERFSEQTKTLCVYRNGNMRKKDNNRLVSFARCYMKVIRNLPDVKYTSLFLLYFPAYIFFFLPKIKYNKRTPQ